MGSEIKRPSILIALLIGAVGALCAWFPPLILVAPGLFAYLLLAGDVLRIFVAVALSALGAYALASVGGVVIYGGLILIALAIVLMLKKQRAYFDTALLCAAIATVIFYLATNLHDLMNGNSAFYTLQEYYRAALQAMTASGGTFSSFLPAGQMDALIANGDYIAAQLPVIMPAALCLFGAVSALSSVVLAARLSVKAHVPIRPMRRFIVWRLPKSFLWGAVVLIAGVIVLSFLDAPALDAITPAVLIVCALPFFVQGLSAYWFIMVVGQRGTANRILLIVLLIILPAPTLLVLTLFGMLEQFMHFRKRLVQRKTGRDE